MFSSEADEPDSSGAKQTFIARLVAWIRRNVEIVPFDADDDSVGEPSGSPYAHGNSSPGAIMASRSGLDR
jgi:hypothetical protein